MSFAINKQMSCAIRSKPIKVQHTLLLAPRAVRVYRNLRLFILNICCFPVLIYFSCIFFCVLCRLCLLTRSSRRPVWKVIMNALWQRVNFIRCPLIWPHLTVFGFSTFIRFFDILFVFAASWWTGNAFVKRSLL